MSTDTKKTADIEVKASASTRDALEEYRQTGQLPKNHTLRVERGKFVLEKKTKK